MANELPDKEQALIGAYSRTANDLSVGLISSTTTRSSKRPLRLLLKDLRLPDF